MTALPKDRPVEFGNDIICHTENPYSETHIEFFNASSVMFFSKLSPLLSNPT